MKRLIFLHIPKSGGSTLHWILHRQYGKGKYHNVKNDRDATAFHDLPKHQIQKAQVLKGHMACGHHTAFGGDPVEYITMLRHPVDRVISNYYFILSMPNHHLHKELMSQGLSLKEYVESGIIANSENAQVRLLGNCIDRPHGGCTQEDLQRAKQNLETHFPVAGTIERYDEFLLLCQDHFGWRPPYYYTVNRTSKRKRVDEIDEETLATILKYNALDLELYGFVKARFEQKWEENRSRLDLQKFRKRNRIYQRLVNMKKRVWR